MKQAFLPILSPKTAALERYGKSPELLRNAMGKQALWKSESRSGNTVSIQLFPESYAA
jgi:hypothetical protein